VCAQVAHEGHPQVESVAWMVGQRQREARRRDLAHERPLPVVLEGDEGADIGEGSQAGVLVGAQDGHHVAAVAGQ